MNCLTDVNNITIEEVLYCLCIFCCMEAGDAEKLFAIASNPAKSEIDIFFDLSNFCVEAIAKIKE